MSTERKTGPVPDRRDGPLDGRLDPDLTDVVHEDALIPCSRCQENSSSPGQ